METDGPQRILVTNDDGIESPGLHAAIEALLPLGEVLAVAPRTQQSAMGRSHRGKPTERLVPFPLQIRGQEVEAYAVACSPAMAIDHGLAVLCHQAAPALVVSGINYGENLGTNTTISGTIGAALEAAARGVPALAVSLETVAEELHIYKKREWQAAIWFARYFAELLLKHGMPPDTDVLKVDVPSDASEQTPWRMAFQSRLSYFSKELGTPHLEAAVGDGQVGRFFSHTAIEPGSDIDVLVQQREVSVTPLSLDLTARTDLQAMAQTWL